MSTPRAVVAQRPNRRWADKQVGWHQKPRAVTHSKIFWLTMAVPFNSVANEVQTAATEAEGFDMLVKAGWTDLTQAAARIYEGESDRHWAFTADFIPVRAMLGNSSEVHPLMPFPQPTLLQSRAQIYGDWNNVGAEPAGTATFHGIKVGEDANGNPYDGRIMVTESMSFWLKLDLGTAGGQPSTAQINNDVLIWGATTNIETSTQTLIQIFDDTSGYPWSNGQIAVQSFAGVDGQPQPLMRYTAPYLVPNNVKIRGNVSTPITGGYIAFYCEKILA